MTESQYIEVPSRIQDLTGRQVGKWTVLGFSHRGKDGNHFWNCKCECGNIKSVSGASLRNCTSKSCGACLSHIPKDNYNKITALRLISKTKINEETGCWEWQNYRSKFGYGMTTVFNSNPISAHILSFRVFCGPIPEGLWVLHRCDNPCCIYPLHLWLGTNQDNMADMVSKGRQCHGEKNNHAKLNREKVNEIREMYPKGGFTYKDIGKLFNVSSSAIYHIINNKTWKPAQNKLKESKGT